MGRTAAPRLHFSAHQARSPAMGGASAGPLCTSAPPAALLHKLRRGLQLPPPRALRSHAGIHGQARERAVHLDPPAYLLRRGASRIRAGVPGTAPATAEGGGLASGITHGCSLVPGIADAAGGAAASLVPLSPIDAIESSGLDPEIPDVFADA
eukprot:CAMPEP_0180178054 /NCGR_PEP_ID=MMETSP0986-20121125/38192_1 /TAXON_ID=697907 /ORGANISM="non described non described, Strain CCMP2293" /LENGTH=152 /DNA_ID=CAMNT_0022130859 /DNA_START=79 /DNA_END=537 /DNA_ORIENTATION=-